MELIDRNNIASYTHVSGIKIPNIIDITCPNCHRYLSVGCHSQIFDGNKVKLMMHSNCPACKEVIHFIVFHPGKENEQVYMYPPSKSSRKEMTALDLVPDGLKRAYYETLNVYRSNNWIASTVMARRTLEGIIYDVIGSSEGSLYKNLSELTNKVNLGEKIVEVAHAIREAGNLGAHYDEKKEPNEEIATTLLDFLEFLLQFVYVLPNQAQNLKDRISSLDNKEGVS